MNIAKHAVVNRKRKIILSIFAVTVTALIAWLFASSYSIYRPVQFNDLAMSRAVEWVQKNGNASREGAISLPPDLAYVSVTGKAYVTNGIIFFPSWIGRKTLLPGLLGSDADWIEGYGFSTKPLPTEKSEPAGSDKFFCMMDLSDTTHAPDNGANGRQMAVSNRINKRWYEIDSFS